MFRTTRITRTTLVLPFAALSALACGGDKESSTVRTAEASTVTPTPVERPVTTTETGLVGGVLTDVAFANGDDAYKAGSFKEAVRLFKLHTETKPEDAHGFYMLGLASWKAGDFERAKDAFDKSIELDSGFAKTYFNSARVLLDLKRAPEALERITQGLAVDSTSPDGWRLKARAQSENGDVAAAVMTYRTMLVKDDEDAWGLNNYGVFLMQHNCVSEALGPLARAVQVRPTAPVFLNNFGMALERSGYKVAALRHYEEAVRKDSTFTKAVKNAERLKAIVADSTGAGEVDVVGLAESFRQLVRTWRSQ